MKDNYLVSVKSITSQPGNDSEKSEFDLVTRAVFEGDSEHYTLAYMEVEDGEERKTAIEYLGRGKIIIERDSRFSSYIVLESGKRTMSEHSYLFRNFSLGITTHYIDSKITSEGGRLRFSYRTDIGFEPQNDFVFDITITKLFDKEDE